MNKCRLKDANILLYKDRVADDDDNDDRKKLRERVSTRLNCKGSVSNDFICIAHSAY